LRKVSRLLPDRRVNFDDKQDKSQVTVMNRKDVFDSLLVKAEHMASNKPKSRVPRAVPVGEWEFVLRASSEARKVEAGAAGSARSVSTAFDCIILT
jgi:hypothetical protein